MTDRTAFVILFPGRTGSTWLVSSLDSHPRVRAEGERLVPLGPRRQRRWIRRLYRSAEREGLLAAGFKTKLKDVRDLDAFRAILIDHDARVILMDRRNVVKLAVSTINARRLHRATGRWNRHGQDPVLPPFELPEEDLRIVIAECLARRDSLLSFAATLPLPTMTVGYEDLLAAPEVAMGEVLAFLGVPPAPLESPVAKNTDDDLRRVITNVEALRDAFASSAYADGF